MHKRQLVASAHALVLACCKAIATATFKAEGGSPAQFGRAGRARRNRAMARRGARLNVDARGVCAITLHNSLRSHSPWCVKPGTRRIASGCFRISANHLRGGSWVLNYLEPAHEVWPFFVGELWPRGLIDARPRKVPYISFGTLNRMSGYLHGIEVSLRTASVSNAVHGVPDS